MSQIPTPPVVAQNQAIDPSVPAKTTFQEDLVTQGQRHINVMWERTQQIIAIMVSVSVTAVCSSVILCTRSPVQCVIDVFYTDSSDAEIIPEASLNLRSFYVVPSAAGSPCTQAAAYVGAAGSGVLSDAMNTARASETGTAQRRQSFRVLGYLSDRGCLPGITVGP